MIAKLRDECVSNRDLESVIQAVQSDMLVITDEYNDPRRSRKAIAKIAHDLGSDLPGLEEDSEEESY
jgi:hypothetical protein